MSKISKKIAREKFSIPKDTLQQVTSDHAEVQALGAKILDAPDIRLPPGRAHDKALRIWQDWMDRAAEAGVTLPYTSPAERFSGRFPSYLSEEQAVIKYILSGNAEAAVREPPVVLTTIGAPGAGKSTLLKKLAADETLNALRSDPDEGVLENLGPFLFGRHILHTTGGHPDPRSPIERQILELNQWRSPPYDTFRWASNIINTNITATAVAALRDVEFHWTGAGAFGLSLIRDGYKAAGYQMDAVLLVTGHNKRLALEALRARPCAPDDFDTKALGYIALLPQSLALADRIRIYDGDAIEPHLVFEAKRDPASGELTVALRDTDGLSHVLQNMNADIERCTSLPDPKTGNPFDVEPARIGLNFLQNLTDQPPRGLDNGAASKLAPGRQNG